MDDRTDTPTISQAFADAGQTLPWMNSTAPSESYRPKPSAKIRNLVARIGLRYRPTNQTDLEAHAASLALLAEDIADLPADLLEQAIQRHVATSPYMPKAADLIRLAKDIEAGKRPTIERTGSSYAHDLAATYNARRSRTDTEWYVDGSGQVKIRLI